MLDVIENPKEVNVFLKDEPKMEKGVIEDLAKSLRENFHGLYPNTVGDGRGNSIWVASRQTYSDDEWSELIKSLRLAEDDIRHVRFTNSYVEQRLNEYHNELKDMIKTSEIVAEKLNELSKTDMEFTRAVFSYLSRRTQRESLEARNLKFRTVARKSKSAECSMHKMCSSCGLMMKECHGMPRREKTRRRKEYGKYCSTCGAIEVPSQNSMIRCRDCNGEVILQGLCSSCDSLDVGKQFKTGSRWGEPPDENCSTCEYLRKRIWMSDKSQCKKAKLRKDSVFFCRSQHKHQKDYEESSYCSDCGFTSSCDVSHKRNMSAESIIPRSDSDNVVTGMIPYSCDYDVSSSVSSIDPESGKSSLVPLLPSRIEETDASLDEDYATPREYLSSEDISLVETDSVESTVVGIEEVSEETNSDDYVQAQEPSDPEEVIESKISTEIIVHQPVLDNVCERLHRAEEALGDITTGNLKLEEGIETMEDLSQQNLKLSMIIRDIVIGMTDRLNEIREVTPETDSENSDEFEEAVDESKTDTETETFYDIQPPSHCYLCLECGIGMSHQQLTNCPTCDRKLAEIPKGFFEGFNGESSPHSTGKELVPAHCICKNWRVNDPLISTFPVIVRGNFPSHLPLTPMEDRLKLIERETNLLRDNNEIINLFVDDFKRKLKEELECVQSLYSRKSDIGETTIVGFDVSFYQITRHITERRTSEESIIEEVCEQRKTFVEMKFEEVYKKEQQTALELEIFEQKLEVEGLIIKETEDFFTCSNVSQTVEETRSLPLSQVPPPEKFPTAERDSEKNNLLISIEIEVEKDKKAIRCEYKANLQKGRLDEERTLPTITLYPMWASNRGALGHSSGKMTETSEFNPEEPFFIDMERDDFVEIKSPKSFSGSSDDEDDWDREKERIIGNAVVSVVISTPMHSVMEIRPPETPFAVLNVLSAKKEFSRVSQIELNHSPESGVVFLQTEGVSSLSVIDCHQDDSLEEFFEAKSDASFQRNNSNSLLRKATEKSLVRFVPVDMGMTSIASISLPDETFPIVVTDEAKPDFVPELTTALSLIREIENDVVEVKLHNAIAILPQLESVLREHLQDKMKVLKVKSSTVSSASLDVFMSTLNFLAEDGEEREEEVRVMESEERLGKILNLLTGLEEAVREIKETDDDTKECEKPERIYDLLRDLGSRIEGIGGDVDVSAVEETLQLTSELDVAVRNYSRDMLKDVEVSHGVQDVGDSIITPDILKSMRKKILEMVAFEAEERDARIEEDMKRIARLEKENMEAMLFLDTLLDKTLRRVGELDDIRSTAILLRNEIEELAKAEKSMMPGVRIAPAPILPSIREASSDCRTNSEDENVKETLSGMIVTLDYLKTKAKEKTEVYKEIFGDGREITRGDGLGVTSSSETQSRGEEGKCRITEFSRIGANTYFMTWTRPVDAQGIIVGYEIWANGKVNQRVRNPERLKAVLYSVHPTNPGGKIRMRLFALTDDGRRSSLADLRYPEE